MPPATRRAARAEAFLKSYIRNHKGRLRRALLRRRAAARARRVNAAERTPTFDVELCSIPSSDSDSDTSDTSSASSDHSSHSTSSSSDSHNEWSDILGPNWRFTSETMLVDCTTDSDTTSTSDTSSSITNQSMPDLFSVDSESSGSESESDIDWNWESGVDGDDEDEDEDGDREDDASMQPRLRKWVQSEIDSIYEQRYEQPRDTLPRGPSYLHHVLTALKTSRPDHFR
ncbi:hypothetical protein K438DRAFT_1970705 [Mycena galopus ATCC 62051]|nr:hypothetical protein K438DRAFT_1970705 [Mycena galopus ATCC 62051]